MFGTRRRGETGLMSEREVAPKEQRRSTSESAAQRGHDDRRSTVRPSDDPAPVSPTPDADAIRKGEEVLERIKPY
jgi:hypothetical protein